MFHKEWWFGLKYSKEFIEENERLKKLDKEALDEQLRNMSTEELLDRLSLSIDQELGEDNILTSEEIDAQVEKIMQLASAQNKPSTVKRFKNTKKMTFLVAAVIVMISLISVIAVASTHDIDIKNGVVSYFRETLSVRFLKDNENENFMTASEVELDLYHHGFVDAKIPMYFFEDGWISEKPKYTQDDSCNQVSLIFKNGDITFSLRISNGENGQKFSGLENAITVEIEDKKFYVLDHGNNSSQILYFYNDYGYDIHSYISYEKMIEFAKRIN